MLGGGGDDEKGKYRLQGKKCRKGVGKGKNKANWKSPPPPCGCKIKGQNNMIHLHNIYAWEFYPVFYAISSVFPSTFELLSVKYKDLSLSGICKHRQQRKIWILFLKNNKKTGAT